MLSKSSTTLPSLSCASSGPADATVGFACVITLGRKTHVSSHGFAQLVREGPSGCHSLQPVIDPGIDEHGKFEQRMLQVPTREGA